jgi:hypothetical protein
MRKRKIKKKKKVVPVQVFGEPSDKDRQMAKAYGGAPRGAPKRPLPKGVGGPLRDSETPISQMHRASK